MADVAVVAEALSPLGKVVRVGDLGQAMAAKLAINALFATQVAATGAGLDVTDHLGGDACQVSNHGCAHRAPSHRCQPKRSNARVI